MFKMMTLQLLFCLSLFLCLDVGLMSYSFSFLALFYNSYPKSPVEQFLSHYSSAEDPTRYYGEGFLYDNTASTENITQERDLFMKAALQLLDAGDAINGNSRNKVVLKSGV